MENLDELSGKSMGLLKDKEAAPHASADEDDLLPDGGARVLPGEMEEDIHPEAEEEFDFDPQEGKEDEPLRWFAMARFYSSQSSRGLFDEMAKAWNASRPIPMQGLENNRYIIEFESEVLYNFVINGGPWRHKGDGLIVVPYDGLRRPSEVVIDAVNVWVRFYDVPVTLRTPNFSAVLARKVSPKVLEGGGPVPNKNFLRARVALALEEPLKPTVEAKVKGQSVMSFEVGYENVPFFCFTCGRMGHSKRECPEEEEDSDEEESAERMDEKKKKKLGEWMRKSPLKRSSKQLAIPTAPRVNRALYFSGNQLARLQAAGSATGSNTGRRMARGAEGSSDLQGGGRGDQSPLKLPWKVSQELSNNVRNLEVSATAGQENEADARDRVSGLDSYVDSSTRSKVGSEPSKEKEVEVPRKSIQERLKEIKAAKAKEGPGRKGGVLGSSPVKDMGKHQKKKAMKDVCTDSERALKKSAVWDGFEGQGWKETTAGGGVADANVDLHMTSREEVEEEVVKEKLINSKLGDKLGDLTGTQEESRQGP
ncbi:unnamed protein product [Urochloa humidicola]